MARIKLLKVPVKPRIPKKPAKGASLQTLNAWMRRVNDMKAKYLTKLNAITAENKKRLAENEAAKKAGAVIAGINDVMQAMPASFKIINVRAPRKATNSIGKTKIKKAPPKKKAAPKQLVRRKK